MHEERALNETRTRTGEGRERAKARGVKMGRPHKLTPHQRQEILRRKENGEAVREIARSYSVHNSTISRLAFESQWSELANTLGQTGLDILASLVPRGVRRHFRPFIEDVDDRLRDLIQERDSCQKYPLYKKTFF